ncbi:MAG: SDR family NAD(P)-dependent oxidoreductase, partial [Burkholderiaceae bacterium]
HTAYSAAKFAVKGFTEALLNDLRLNAPHVRCALVMPGHVASQIAQNSQRAMPRTLERLAVARKHLARQGVAITGLDDEEVLAVLRRNADHFRDSAPTSAEQAAAIILDGVRAGRWRILVGEDAAFMDRRVREDPENAYEPAFALALAQARDQREQARSGA